MEDSYWNNIDTQGTKPIFCPGDVTEKPPVNENHLRLYTNPLCPYAVKAKLALAAKNLQFQEANIDLNDKPPYFVEAGGQVPILEKQDGTQMPESSKILEFAGTYDTGIVLFPIEDTQRQSCQAFAIKLEESINLCFIFRAIINGGEENITKLKDTLEKVDNMLSENTEGNKYLNNQPEVSYLDIQYSPFFLNACIAIEGEIPTIAEIHLSNYPKLAAYIKTMLAHETLGPHYQPSIPMVNFMLEKIKNSEYKLPYPLNFFKDEDTQSLKKLYVLNAHTAKPKTNRNYPRIYGHPLCPFVERALLAFRAKQIEYQFVGVDLTEKNKWHKDINGGLVPFLETTDGTIIPESLDVSEWAQENSQNGVDLFPRDEANKQEIKKQIEALAKVGFEGFKGFFTKENRESDGPKMYTDALNQLNTAIEDSNTQFFNNEEHETFLDLMLLPIVHRLFLLKETKLKESYCDKIDFSKIKKLMAWYDTLEAKYRDTTCEGVDFREHLGKHIAANGPKVQLYYPIPSEC